MKIEAHPLVVAAALGFLGPAALAEDEDDTPTGFAGLWNRVDNQSVAAAQPSGDLRLGPELEVIPLDDRLILDDGTTEDASWTLQGSGVATQELLVDGARVTRELTHEATDDRETLEVRTTVHQGSERTVLFDSYTRSV